MTTTIWREEEEAGCTHHPPTHAVWELQMVEQCYRLGLTTARFAFYFLVSFAVFTFLFRKPTMLFAFFMVLSIWGFQLKSLELSTPRFLELVECSSVWLFSL